MQDPTHPAGLNNLGNTCYVNSALQCLFAVPAFRAALYAAEPPLAGRPILSHRRSLFAALQFGPRTSVDTTDLAKALNLEARPPPRPPLFRPAAQHAKGRSAARRPAVAAAAAALPPQAARPSPPLAGFSHSLARHQQPSSARPLARARRAAG